MREASPIDFEKEPAQDAVCNAPPFTCSIQGSQCICGDAQHSARRELLLQQHLTVVNDLAGVSISTAVGVLGLAVELEEVLMQCFGSIGL